MTAEVAVPIGGQGANTTDRAPTGEAGLSGIPNTAPLNLFPQVYFMWFNHYHCMLKHLLTIKQFSRGVPMLEVVLVVDHLIFLETINRLSF